MPTITEARVITLFVLSVTLGFFFLVFFLLVLAIVAVL